MGTKTPGIMMSTTSAGHAQSHETGHEKLGITTKLALTPGGISKDRMESAGLPHTNTPQDWTARGGGDKTTASLSDVNVG